MTSEQPSKEFVERLLREVCSRDYSQNNSAELLRAELKQLFSNKPLAVDVLLAIAKDKGSDERIPAIIALGELGNPEAVPEIVSILRDDGDSFLTRGFAAEALGQIGDPQAIEALAETTADENVGRQACLALSRIQHPRSVESLILAVAHEDSSFEARRALMSVTSQHALQPLIGALSHEDPALREFAVECLGRFKHHAVVSALTKALTDAECGVRVAAANALGVIRDFTAVDRLIETLSDGVPEVKVAARTALECITGKTFFVGGGAAEKWKKWWEANKGRMVRSR